MACSALWSLDLPSKAAVSCVKHVKGGATRCRRTASALQRTCSVRRHDACVSCSLPGYDDFIQPEKGQKAGVETRFV
jgi:hypothetical protein